MWNPRIMSKQCVVLLLAICFFGLPVQAKYGGGTGEPNNPYLIYTAEQLNTIGSGLYPCILDKHFKLMADIDLFGFTGTRFQAINPNPINGATVVSRTAELSWTAGAGAESHDVYFGTSYTSPFIGNQSLTTFNPGTMAYNTTYYWRIDEVRAYDKIMGIVWRFVTMPPPPPPPPPLMADIDLGAYTGTSFNIIGTYGDNAFTGVFDGNGHTISNFTYTSTNRDYIGLFGYVRGGVIKNLGLIDPNVDAGTLRRVGSLVGQLDNGTITNCYVEAGSVVGESFVGGLVGDNYYGGTITNCYSTGSVTGEYYVGGMVGRSIGTITNCYATGVVVGESEVSVGGLVGRTYYGSEVVACFWDIEASGQLTSNGGTGKTTAEMQTASTFIGWGCYPVWTIDEGNDYPRLAWENMPGVLITITSYGGGSGEPNDPYLIYTTEQLNIIGLIPCPLDKHFKLMADIDLGSITGRSFNIIGNYNTPFTGVFDGNGHTILNFSYTSTGTSNIGLFGYVDGPNAQIKNLGIIDPNIDAGTGSQVGSLVAYLENGAISNCYVEGGSVSGNYTVGGLVGRNYHGKITNCYSLGDVAGSSSVGGLIGRSGPEPYWGNGTISYSYSAGGVSGDSMVGGLVGFSTDKIIDCYSTASVSGNNQVGGLVGLNGEACYYWSCSYGTITNCYSTGSVEGDDDVGGLVGYNGGQEEGVMASFWDIETSGQTTSAGGIGKTTAEMQTASTFYGWACGDHVWTINEGIDYPRLWWENKPGELITIPSELYGGGSGDPNDPYLIYTAEQLNTIGLIPCDWDKHFRFVADIDLRGYTGTSFNIIGNYNTPFTGVFDGNGHTILNFTCDSNDRDYIGLFGYVDGPNAQIKNLGIIDPNIDAGTGGYIGSLIGYLRGGTITNCYIVAGSLSGDYYVGGLVGYNSSSGAITNCCATGDVTGNYYVGGLVGDNYYGGTITDCYSHASVAGDRYVGGLVGWNYGTITNCYSHASVSGEDYVGGLVGYNYYSDTIGNGGNGSITNCYSTGSVTGSSRVGGLVGYGYSQMVTNSFWDVETSGQTTSDGGTGLATEQMQTMSTFTDAGWDFVGETVNGIEDIWFIPQQDYPHLWWETYVPAEVKIVPPTITLASKDKWIAAFLRLPEDYNVADIISETVRLQEVIAPDLFLVNEKQQVAIATFSREEVQNILDIGEVELTITGWLTDWTRFKGMDTIKIIDKNSGPEPKDPNSKHEKKDRSLLAHWKFDDGSGNIAIDSAGKNDGILLGDPVWTTGIIGGALSFDGDGDYVAVDAVDALTGDTFTIQAWICVSEFAGLWNPVLIQHDLSNDGCYFYVASSRPSFYIVEYPVFAQAISHEAINANQWYHIAVTNDGSALNLYVNGLLKSTASSSGLTGVNYNAYIGCEPAMPLYYNGLIDDVRIYDRALTEDEIIILVDY
jgi:hypothetical protein